MDPSSVSGATGIEKSELKIKKLVVGASGFELGDLLRPRQARYQAALRPDMKCL